jgi:hypothetical protein
VRIVVAKFKVYVVLAPPSAVGQALWCVSTIGFHLSRREESPAFPPSKNRG